MIEQALADIVEAGLLERVSDGVDTRLPAFHIHVVPLASGRVALVLRVPASLRVPHRAVYGKISRFHARNSRGKFETDTTELRRAFEASGSVRQRLRALHDRAVALSQESKLNECQKPGCGQGAANVCLWGRGCQGSSSPKASATLSKVPLPPGRGGTAVSTRRGPTACEADDCWRVAGTERK